MKINEIKVGGVYKTTLNVQFRSEKEIKEVDFFVRVLGKTSECLEVSFLNDNNCYYLNPSQIDMIE